MNPEDKGMVTWSLAQFRKELEAYEIAVASKDRKGKRAHKKEAVRHMANAWKIVSGDWA